MRRTSRCARGLGAVAGLALLAACAATPPDREELLALAPAPYKVLLVFSARDPRLEKRYQPLWEKIASQLEAYQTFSLLEWVPSNSVVAGAAAKKIDEGTFLQQAAQSKAIDRIVFVWLDEGEVEDRGPNTGAFPATLLWLALGVPSFFIPDRSYSSGFSVGTHVMDPGGDLSGRELKDLPIPDSRLSFWERGFTPLCLLVPPFLLAGESEDWRPLAERKAFDLLVRTLVQHFKSTTLPPDDVCFEYQPVRAKALDESGNLSFRILSKEPISNVELRVGSATYGQWNREELASRRDIVGARSRYSFALTVPLDETVTAIRISCTCADQGHTGTIVIRKERLP